MFQYFDIFNLFILDECVPHHVANGNVTQISDENHPTKVWRVQCHNGFTMVGTDRIKCRKGIMTAKFPVCTSKFGQSNDIHGYIITIAYP